jgi:tetratricopeptide (TPR) repeat protein/predicted Ser/Thr protein kinase
MPRADGQEPDVPDPTGTASSDDALSTRFDGGASPEARDDPSPWLEVGRRVGRYVVLRELGRGGMGVVLAAFDEELDRKVAIKLLRPDLSVDASSHMRLLREAQAMAKLSHPNVAQVYEVGEVQGRIFLAMELVPGKTLRAWLREGPHALPRLLEVSRQAGAGLCAAHHVGLVHRDFKPENVMVRDDGRVCVLDFGLARGDASQSEDGSSDSSRRLDLSLTRADTVVGTPAYMSPEQHLGQLADARSDQFSFCVVLYEAVYGERPFQGDRRELVHAAIHDGVPPERPGARNVPAWLRRALVRGLDARPEARWPSMDALLVELGRDPGRPRRRALVVALGLGLLGTGYAAASLGEPEADPCAHARRRLEGAWDPERKQAVREALLATGVGYAEATWSRVEETLDGYAERWEASAVETCEAHQRNEQSDTLFDLRMRCLERRRVDLLALVDVLAAADRTVVENAAAGTAKLGAIEPCSDPDALTVEGAHPEDPEIVAASEPLWGQHARVRALQLSGRYPEALDAVGRLVIDARALGHRPLLAEALLMEGELHSHLRDPERARVVLDESWLVAEAMGMDRVKTRALGFLAFAVGYDGGRPDEGLAWAARAQASLDRLGGDGLLQAMLDNNVGSVHMRAGRLEQARDTFVGALERGEGVGPTATVPILTNLGAVLQLLGEHDRVLEIQARALAASEHAYGVGHPQTGHALLNLGGALHTQLRYDEALEHFDRGVAAFEGGYGDRHLLAAAARVRRGYVLRRMGRSAEARIDLEHAMEIVVADGARKHPDLASIKNNLAEIELEAGNLAAARPLFEAALAIWEEAGWERFLPYPLAGLGRLALAEGDARSARPLLERALEMRTTIPGTLPEELAETRFGLAQAIAQDEPQRALTLATAARDFYRSAGPYHTHRLERASAWIAAHEQSVGGLP